MTGNEGPEPTIYAYTTESEAKRPWARRSGGSGRIKVGYTERDVRQRVREQENAPEQPPILFEAPARNQEGDTFDDSVVHRYLVQLGAARLSRGESGAPSEWFEATLDEVRRAHRLACTGGRSEATQDFRMRTEQERAVEAAAEYFRGHSSDSRDRHFLWNAKMRFGKTFAAYQLAREMGWRRVLVLTFKPAAEGSWREIIEQHADFGNWQFVGNQEDWSGVDEARPLAQLVSFQNLMGRSPRGQVKESLELVHAEDWDCIVVDEYHFGAWRDGARDLYDPSDKQDREDVEDADDYRKDRFEFAGETLTAKHWLYLSGTPFRALARGEFLEEQIFNWTYQNEQTEKRRHADNPASPYADLPGLELYVYRMGDAVREHASSTFEDEFDLNEFFKAATAGGGGRFRREQDVQHWLDWLHKPAAPGEPPSCAPYAATRLRQPLRHAVWFLPDVAACMAMKSLLDRDPFFGDFEVVLAAGRHAGSGIKALGPVNQAIGDGTKTRTITLTCGKLMTGVTVPQWGGIFVLRNLQAAETWFQAAFRVQSPWSAPDPVHPERRRVFKETAYIFDFAPQRALDLISGYCASTAGAEREQPAEVADFLDFLPVLCHEGGRMERLDANELLAVAYAGIGPAMLARRWQSPHLVRLDRDTLSDLLDDEGLCAALSEMEAFRNLRDHARRVVNSDDAIRKLRRQRESPDAAATKDRNEAKKKRQELRDKLLLFLCRVPLFMYLTDFREETLSDVIRRVETPLFIKVTGLQLEHFDQLCKIGVFNERALNGSIYAFRQQEKAHLIAP